MLVARARAAARLAAPPLQGLAAAVCLRVGKALFSEPADDAVGMERDDAALDRVQCNRFHLFRIKEPQKARIRRAIIQHRDEDPVVFVGKRRTVPGGGEVELGHEDSRTRPRLDDGPRFRVDLDRHVEPPRGAALCGNGVEELVVPSHLKQRVERRVVEHQRSRKQPQSTPAQLRRQDPTCNLDVTTVQNQRK